LTKNETKNLNTTNGHQVGGMGNGERNQSQTNKLKINEVRETKTKCMEMWGKVICHWKNKTSNELPRAEIRAALCSWLVVDRCLATSALPTF